MRGERAVSTKKDIFLRIEEEGLKPSGDVVGRMKRKSTLLLKRTQPLLI